MRYSGASNTAMACAGRFPRREIGFGWMRAAGSQTGSYIMLLSSHPRVSLLGTLGAAIAAPFVSGSTCCSYGVSRRMIMSRRSVVAIAGAMALGELVFLLIGSVYYYGSLDFGFLVGIPMAIIMFFFVAMGLKIVFPRR